MKVIELGCKRGLNIRSLFHVLFFNAGTKHTDAKRQRCERIRTRSYAQARQLKRQYVPLCHVARPMIFVRNYGHNGYEGEWTEMADTFRACLTKTNGVTASTKVSGSRSGRWTGSANFTEVDHDWTT